MGLLNIVGRLSLDGQPFQNTLKAAEKQADNFAAGLRKKTLGRLASGGAGFLALRSISNAVGEAMTEAREIDLLAKKFELTTTQVQMLQQEAEKTGKPFADLVKNGTELEATLERLGDGSVKFSSNVVKTLSTAQGFIDDVKTGFVGNAGKFGAGIMGGISKLFGIESEREVDAAQQQFALILRQRKEAEEAHRAGAADREKAAENIRKINAEAKDIEEKTADEQLTRAERLEKLTEKRRQMVEEIAKFPHEPGSEGEASDRLRVAKLDAQIAGLRGDAGTRAASRERTLSPLSDSLTSVGNFLGANPNAETRNQLSEANRTLKSIERKLSEQRTGGNFPL